MMIWKVGMRSTDMTSPHISRSRPPIHAPVGCRLQQALASVTGKRERHAPAELGHEGQRTLPGSGT